MGWIIAGAVLIAVLLLLLCRVTVIFDYCGSVYLKVKYFCFTVVKLPAKRRKSKGSGKKAKKAEKSAVEAANAAENAEPGAEKPSGEAKEKSAGASAKKEKKPSLSDIFELAKLALDSVGKPLKKILKRTVISHLSLEIICGGENAAKAALKYGGMNIVVGNALGWIDSFFTLKPADDIHISVDFESSETTAKCYCEVRLTLAAALAFAFTLLGRAVRYYLRHEDAKAAVKKLMK